MKAHFTKASFVKEITSTLLFCIVFASTAQADSDPVTECRQAHAADPTAHIACLEVALNKANEDLHVAHTEVSAANATAAQATSALGAEQVKQKQRATGEISEQPESVNIVEARYNSGGLGAFKLDNGQIWRETEESPYHLRLKTGQSYQAVIERGSMGGYRMQVEGIKRMLKIERLK